MSRLFGKLLLKIIPEESRIHKCFRSVSRFLSIFKRVFDERSIYKESAALTFVTIMGFLPFVTFIIYMIPKTSLIGENSALKQMLLSVFVPDSAEQVSIYMEQLINRQLSLNLISILMIFITSFSLFRIINDTFDRILNVHEIKEKGLIKNLLKFFGMILFGFFILLLIFSSPALSLLSNIMDKPYLNIIANYFIPFLMLFFIILLVFIFVPTIRIRNKSSVIGAAISAVLWIIVKNFYSWYVSNVLSMKLIWGFLSSIPVMIMWIYFNWMIIMSGFIIVAILENRHNSPDKKKIVSDTLTITLHRCVEGSDEEEVSDIPENDLRSIIREIVNEGKKKK